MSIETASFIFGGILLLVGVLGGGFEVKELKIPKVGMGVRALASLVGLLFVALGFGTNAQNSGKTAAPASAYTNQAVYASQAAFQSPPETPVEFIIVDDLSPSEISEQVTLLVDGKNVGNLTVNQYYPHSSLRVSVNKAGQHSFTAEAAAVFNIQGNAMQYGGVGQGIVNVEPGKTYDLRGSISGNTWLVSLEQRQ